MINLPIKVGYVSVAVLYILVYWALASVLPAEFGTDRTAYSMPQRSKSFVKTDPSRVRRLLLYGLCYLTDQHVSI